MSDNVPHARLPWRHRLLAVFALVTLVLWGNAAAGPGAHGPGGQHLDAPAAAAAGGASPRLETKSELFELVATLQGGELSILIDRFETNEPVLGASVEVQAGALKAAAKFHADHGDYAIDDAAFLTALSQPGEHALIFTIVVADDTDLLDGVLAVGPATATQAHAHGERTDVPPIVWVIGGLLAVSAVLFVAARFRARRKRNLVFQGGRS